MYARYATLICLHTYSGPVSWSERMTQGVTTGLPGQGRSRVEPFKLTVQTHLVHRKLAIYVPLRDPISHDSGLGNICRDCPSSSAYCCIGVSTFGSL